jgi:NIMA (never in mitosis gene a)-related kinase
MPQMPRIYSAELVQLIKAMLNQNPERRPSVNRILRDPYIKRNIAKFLEGTKKR